MDALKPVRVAESSAPASGTTKRPGASQRASQRRQEAGLASPPNSTRNRANSQGVGSPQSRAGPLLLTAGTSGSGGRRRAASSSSPSVIGSYRLGKTIGKGNFSKGTCDVSVLTSALCSCALHTAPAPRSLNTFHYHNRTSPYSKCFSIRKFCRTGK